MRRANNSHPGGTGTYGANIHSGSDKRSLSNVSTHSSLLGNRNRRSCSYQYIQPFLHSYLPSCWADSTSRCIQVSISCWETPRATYTCPSLLTSSGQMAVCWFSSCCCSGLIVIPSRNRGRHPFRISGRHLFTSRSCSCRVVRKKIRAPSVPVLPVPCLRLDSLSLPHAPKIGSSAHASSQPDPVRSHGECTP